MRIRDYMVAESLKSFRQLDDIAEQLTYDEVTRALQLEARTQRRPTVLRKLISIASRKHKVHLQEKYLGYQKESRCEAQTIESNDSSPDC
jgi:hypothetical protein